MKQAKRLGITTCLLTMAVGAASCTMDVGLSETGANSGNPGDASAASKTLSSLQVQAEGAGDDYERAAFGTRWKDTDRNGCDQRNDVLARDLENVGKDGSCIVMTGRLHDPYSGKDITFAKKDAAEVQIDHLYPLALAWRMGASRWSEDKRETFANDHRNLLAVWGVPNQQKSDSGPGEWKPRKSFQCTYAIKYIAVAHKYTLPVTHADREALRGFLTRCRGSE
ncbi:HNH endonuclease family protein [Actinomadura sp. 3N407]|uniref:HNH endonuclease family protein n=1 Tax=Actinomadura sp. 3N407 TaxID=3457423 RepID=UPI003FCE25B5